MNVRLLQTPQELSAYDAWVKSHAQGSLWQSLEWKGFQEALGRGTRLYAAMEGEEILASALAIIDRTAFGLTTWDIPRGPLARQMENEKFEIRNTTEQLLKSIIVDAKKEHCLSMYFSSAQPFCISHFPFLIRPSGRHEQPEATRMVDLKLTEGEILAQMHSKGRYNIRVAEKHGVKVQKSQDVQAFYRLLKTTGDRDAFGILPLRQYEAFLKNIPGSFLLLAFPPPLTPPPREEGNLSKPHSPSSNGGRGRGMEEEPIAGLLAVIWGKTGIYYYGASNYAHRALMAPYLLQWEAMKHCKAQGCITYDLLGVAPEGSGNSHPWAGITSFKEKFGGTFVTSPKEQQIILRPVMSTLLRFKRKILG